MFFATQLQSLEYVRALLTAQAQDDAEGEVLPATADETSDRDAKRAALLAGTYRPPCGCSPDPGPVPCDAAILAVLAPEPIPGCPNVGKGE
jgi:hypothetical protein